MNLLKTVAILAVLLIMSVGCGDNSNEQSAPTTTTTSLPVVNSSAAPLVVLSKSSEELTQSEQRVVIDVNLFEASNGSPLSGSKVKIFYPRNDLLSGRDIGSFASSEVITVNGVASFVYTGPADLDSNRSDIDFSFYYGDDFTTAKNFKLTIKAQTNQTVLTNYKLSSNIEDSTMGIESAKIISFSVHEESSRNNLVSNSAIGSIKVTTLNPALATLSGTDGNKTGVSLTFLESSENDFKLLVNSARISGVVPLKVDATFTDVNSKEQNLTKVFNLVIMSGPPSAISLNYAGTESADESLAGFIENWTLRVTDKYNNLVNSNPSVSMGMITGFAVDSNLSGVGADNYLYFDRINGGTLSKTTFTAPKAVFANVNQATDSLVLFGDGYVYDASGKWDFNTNSDTVLELIDKYDGNDTSSLGFAVGYNYRQIPEGGEAIANIYPKDRNYTMDDTGTMTLKVALDPFLVGKGVMLWVNLIGYDLESAQTSRVGEARKITLRGLGLESKLVNVPADAKSLLVRIPVELQGSPEYYRHANFSYNVKVSPKLTIDSIADTNFNLANNIAYVDVVVSAIDTNASDENETATATTVELTNLIVVDEF